MRFLALLAALVLISGCASSQLANQIARGEIRPDNVEAVQDGEFQLGFNKAETRAALGGPDRVNIIYTRKGQREQWIYGTFQKRFYVYFNPEGTAVGTGEN